MKTKRIKVKLTTGETIEAVQHDWGNGETDIRDMKSNKIAAENIEKVEE